MVTAGNGTISMKGVSGKTYNLNFYSSDVIGAATTFNLNGLAASTSQNFYIIPENCVITDISFASSNTVSTNWVLQINDQNIGVVVAIANQLNTLATRATPNVPLPGNRKYTMIQA
jgi:hypothetical protein